MSLADCLLPKVKKHLILDHDEDDELLKGFIRAAITYAEGYQKKPEGAYSRKRTITAKLWSHLTEHAVVMLSAHFYESRDGSTGGFFADSVQAGQQAFKTINTLLALDKDWEW